MTTPMQEAEAVYAPMPPGRYHPTSGHTNEGMLAFADATHALRMAALASQPAAVQVEQASQPPTPVQPLGEAPHCTWTPEDEYEMPGTYITGCGEMFSLVEGDLKEHRFKYCYSCGAAIFAAAGNPVIFPTAPPSADDRVREAMGRPTEQGEEF